MYINIIHEWISVPNKPWRRRGPAEAFSFKFSAFQGKPRAHCALTLLLSSFSIFFISPKLSFCAHKSFLLQAPQNCRSGAHISIYSYMHLYVLCTMTTSWMMLTLFNLHTNNIWICIWFLTFIFIAYPLFIVVDIVAVIFRPHRYQLACFSRIWNGKWAQLCVICDAINLQPASQLAI